MVLEKINLILPYFQIKAVFDRQRIFEKGLLQFITKFSSFFFICAKKWKFDRKEMVFKYINYQWKNTHLDILLILDVYVLLKLE